MAAMGCFRTFRKVRFRPTRVVRHTWKASWLNLQYLQVWSNFPGAPHDQVMKSVKLFTEDVMPRFEDPSAQAAA
jgi:hypothetical protein